MSNFIFDENKIPEIKMSRSILNSFDDHYVLYDINGFEFLDSSDEEDLENLEKKIYALISWYNRIKTRRQL
jgi:hypothetical protein